MADFHTLLINLGNLAGLTALATQTDHPGVAMWHPRLELPSGPALQRAVERQAQIMGIDRVAVVPPLYEPESSLDLDPRGIAASEVLMAAARHALKLGCHKLIWPLQLGPDFDAVSAALERAQLITSLIELDMDGEPLLIDLPLIELSDAQLGEVALHADAPVQTAWWCEYDRETPCGGCDGCLRWRPVADAAIPPGRAKIAHG